MTSVTAFRKLIKYGFWEWRWLNQSSVSHWDRKFKFDGILSLAGTEWWKSKFELDFLFVNQIRLANNSFENALEYQSKAVKFYRISWTAVLSTLAVQMKCPTDHIQSLRMCLISSLNQYNLMNAFDGNNHWNALNPPTARFTQSENQSRRTAFRLHASQCTI